VTSDGQPPVRPPREGRGVRLREIFAIETGIGAAETGIYVVVALLLLVAGALTLLGTIVDVVQGADARQIDDTGVFLLDRILLLFIVAELLATLRIVNLGGRIHVEPFLFIGLIAVVRKILVLAAEGGEDTTDVVLELAALGGLTLVFSLAIFLLRRSGTA